MVVKEVEDELKYDRVHLHYYIISEREPSGYHNSAGLSQRKGGSTRLENPLDLSMLKRCPLSPERLVLCALKRH